MGQGAQSWQPPLDLWMCSTAKRLLHPKAWLPLLFPFPSAAFVGAIISHALINSTTDTSIVHNFLNPDQRVLNNERIMRELCYSCWTLPLAADHSTTCQSGHLFNKMDNVPVPPLLLFCRLELAPCKFKGITSILSTGDKTVKMENGNVHAIPLMI